MTENKRLFGIVKGHREHIADHTGRLYSDSEVADLLNNYEEENKELKQVLGSILLEVTRDITNTSCTGEIKVFINPNSFNLISDVLRKYGALKEWYE